MKIERKFRVPEAIGIITYFGPLSNDESFTRRRTEAFVDEHVDTIDYQLCAKDVWHYLIELAELLFVNRLKKQWITSTLLHNSREK